jgi:DNA-binding response OmpR family regulator
MSELRLLLIEDNSAVSQTLSLALSQNYELIAASNGEDGLDIAREMRPDIVMLDLNLPGISGLEVCDELRKIGVTAPILVLTADNRLSTKLNLFASGADDFMVKPFSLGELKARLNVVKKRIDRQKLEASTLRTASLILDHSTRTVIRDGGQSIRLRHKEYDLLEELVKNVGQTLSRKRLAASAWGISYEPWSNIIDVHIKHLRDKIDKPYSRPLITTIHGSGYRLENY